MAAQELIGIDIFSGAGGMSIGAMAAGVDVKEAVEIDPYAAFTYSANHLSTKLHNCDIRKYIPSESILKSKSRKILFGGPPCQGFSTSNQKTRNKNNENNWLFKEYLRIAKLIRPEWVIVENVKGILETEGGYFFDTIQQSLKRLGYTTNAAVLNAADYGVPQVRNRVFIVGSLQGIEFAFPKATAKKHITVHEALSDLPSLQNGSDLHEMNYYSKAQGVYQKKIRVGSKKSLNNLVTANSVTVLKRYEHIPEGGNWENIPKHLLSNYKDYSRCHTRIYYRLKSDKPSVVIGNYRKNMLIHPKENRGLSVREAARIQSFPDTFGFYGSIGFQQQQVGNSVPPLLAKVLFKKICDY